MRKGGFRGPERRRYPRLKDNNFILGVLEKSYPIRFKAIACNIGAGGLMFEIDRDISEKSKLKLELYQPTHSDKKMIFSIPILARVIWKRKIKQDNFEPGENIYRIGVQFLEIKEEDRNRIAKYVQEGKLKK